MPISSLRHVFADTVADVDGFIVRTRLGNRNAVVSPAQCRSFADSPPNRRAASSVTKQQPSSSTSGVAFVNRCGLPEDNTGHIGNGGSGVGGISGPQVKGRRTRQVSSDGHYANNEMAAMRRSAAAEEATSCGDVKVAVVQPPTSSATTGFSTANESEGKQAQQPEPLCAFNCCCCCTGRLLLMWLQVSFASPRLASVFDFIAVTEGDVDVYISDKSIFHVRKTFAHSTYLSESLQMLA